jgi:hypothetical protein
MNDAAKTCYVVRMHNIIEFEGVVETIERRDPAAKVATTTVVSDMEERHVVLSLDITESRLLAKSLFRRVHIIITPAEET